jgi:DnaJ-class molecular chaperone
MAKGKACPGCKGAGEIWVESVKKWVTCGTCNGSGTAPE